MTPPPLPAAPAAAPPKGGDRGGAETGRFAAGEDAGLLLEVEGMKCGGCVRAVEQRLLQQPGVLQASANLLNRSAWVDLAATPEERSQRLEGLLASLASLGFPARLREGGEGLPSRRERERQRHWWHHWRQLVTAIGLVVVSGLGHLADAGQLPWQDPWNLLGARWVHALVATVALAGPGRPILLQGARAAWAGLPSMDTLVGLGVVSAWLSSLVGWLAAGSGWPCFFNEPVMLLGFVLSGRFLEERARWRSGRAIEELAALEPEQTLLLLADGSARPVRVGGLRPGDRLRILPGDRIPVDGVVREGSSPVDLSSLTGEPLPLQAEPGSELPAGALNLGAPLAFEVSRSGAQSAIARIVRLVEEAQARKAPIQGLADRVAGRFTLVVLALSLATLLFWWLWGTRLWPAVLHGAAGHAGHPLHGTATPITPLALSLQLAIAVLVVACPCALGLATPTAISVGSGRAARAGLLFRGGDAIETAARLRTVLFDKTGTLTLGRPLVTAVRPAGEPVPGAADRIVQLAASLEQHSRHPLAHALIQEAQLRNLPLLPVEEARTLSGEGLEGRVPDEAGVVRVGRPPWLESLGVAAASTLAAALEGPDPSAGSLLAVAVGEVFLGVVAVEDRPRRDAASTLAELRRRGLALGLLSGDRRAGVEHLAAELGLHSAELAWGLRPEQKLQRILAARSQGPVAMVGDGINDAPALAAADLGIAVGTGTQIAQETAGLVVLGERLEGVVVALDLARATMAKVRQNLAWAFGYNLIVLPIAAGVLLPGFGVRLSPPLAALLMALSSITVVLNALLLQRGGCSAGERQA